MCDEIVGNWVNPQGVGDFLSLLHNKLSLLNRATYGLHKYSSLGGLEVDVIEEMGYLADFNREILEFVEAHQRSLPESQKETPSTNTKRG